MNTIGYFEIQASDVMREVEFYKAVFGWRFIREDIFPIEYYRIETDGISGGLLQRSVAAPAMGGTNAYVCSIEVENFDKTSEIILANGGQVAMAKFGIPGRCWQGYFIDTGNNTFGIFEVMKGKSKQ